MKRLEYVLDQKSKNRDPFERLIPGRGWEGELPYMAYRYMRPQRVWFLALSVLVINRIPFLTILVISRVWFLLSRIKYGFL